MKLNIKKLNSAGFSHHFLMPLVAVVAVVGIGALVMLRLSHAATAGYYNGPCISKTYTSGQNGAPCVTQLQDLLDGAQHAKLHNYVTTTASNGDTFTYGSSHYLLMNGIYNGTTQAAVTAVLKADGKSSEVSTLNGGTGSTADWQLVCTAMADIGVSSNTAGGLNFANATNSAGKVISPAPHTNSSMATIFSNTCGSKTSGGSGSGGNAGGVASAWSLTGTITTSAKSITEGSTLTISGIVKNTGPGTTGSFTYGIRDFASNTATPARPANGGAYPSEYKISTTDHTVPSPGLKAGATASTSGQIKFNGLPIDSYLCFTTAFSPSDSTGAVNGRSTPVCLPVVR